MPQAFRHRRNVATIRDSNTGACVSAAVRMEVVNPVLLAKLSPVPRRRTWKHWIARIFLGKREYAGIFSFGIASLDLNEELCH